MKSEQKEAGTTVPSPAAESVAGHEYLLEQILELLPAKSLGRFKLVSKRWLSLISDQFRRRSSSKSAIGMFLCHVRSNDTKFVPFKALHKSRIPSLEFLKNRRINVNNNLDYNKIEIRQSCNGLLLCRLVITDEPVSSRRELKQYEYVVCNPTTEQFRLLPRVPHGNATTSEGVLAYDPCVSIHYKLICARNQFFDYVLDIYSSEDNSWRVFTSPYLIPWRSSYGHYLNGSVYYKGGEDEHYYHYLRFDVNTEKMTQIRARRVGLRKYFCEYFIEVAGARLWCDIEDKNLAEDIRTLELITNPLGYWVSMSVGDCILTLSGKYPQIAAQEGPLCDILCVVEGRKEGPALVLATPGKVISYNIKHKTVQELCDLQGEYYYFRAFPFTESFFAV